VFLAELRSPKSDVAALLTTFALTVLVDITLAIAVGTVLASFLFIRRMAAVTNVTAISGDDEEADDAIEPWRNRIPRGVTVYEINGPFFFGAAETFKETVGRAGEHPRVLIIRLRDVGALDSTGTHGLRHVVSGSRRAGSNVLLAELNAQPRAALDGSPLSAEIGTDNIYQRIDEALDRAAELVRLDGSRDSEPRGR
jgi:SulP family sulfate permease